MHQAPDTPKRRSRDELRELLLSAGMAVLEEDGLRTGADLTFKRVLARVEADTGIRVTNASIIRRVWADQAEFQSDLMAEVVADVNEAGQLEAAHELLGPLMDSFDVSTPVARWWALLEVARLAGEVAIDSRVGTRNWELWVGVWVVTVTNPATKGDSRLRNALARGLAETGEAWDQLFTTVMRALGRPGAAAPDAPPADRVHRARWPPATPSARPVGTSARWSSVRAGRRRAAGVDPARDRPRGSGQRVPGDRPGLVAAR